jgi:ketopantoate reductase
MAKKPVIVIGMGEMGSVFARGLLRLGHPVYPVLRDTDMKKLAKRLPDAKLVLVAVAESDLQPVLEKLPKAWKKKNLALLQNELLPDDYRHLGDVTVVSVWFEKKKGQDSKVIIPSPVHGPRTTLLIRALATLDIPATAIESGRGMLFELVVKNLYILTSNIAGLRVGGTVGQLWNEHQAFARSVANEVIALQEGLTGSRFNNDELIAAMVRAFEGDPEHRCMGRTARARLERALAHADRLGIDLPTLRSIMDTPGSAAGT